MLYYLSLSVGVCLSIRLSVCLPVCLSVCLVCITTCNYCSYTPERQKKLMQLQISITQYLSFWLSILSICLSVCLSIYPRIYVSVLCPSSISFAHFHVFLSVPLSSLPSLSQYRSLNTPINYTLELHALNTGVERSCIRNSRLTVLRSSPRDHHTSDAPHSYHPGPAMQETRSWR